MRPEATQQEGFGQTFDRENYKDCLSYIDGYWEKIIKTQETDDFATTGAVYLPNPTLVPNEDRFNMQFNWDSYFMMLGILGTSHEYIAEGIVENFSYLYERFGCLPNASTVYFTNRSQPPLFTSMIFEVFERSKNKEWLAKHMAVAKQEYENVWTIESPKTTGKGIGTFHHREKGNLLSHYGDRDAGYPETAMLESGQDFTQRFRGMANLYLPMDLNSLLYKYEKDFAKAAKILGNSSEAMEWEKRAKERKEEINRLLWNEEEGFFFDYNYDTKTRSTFLTLSGFTPLWAGLVDDPGKKNRMVARLVDFETDYGLTITAEKSLIKHEDLPFDQIPVEMHPAIKYLIKPKQWDWPHIWPPVEYLTVVGLLNNGFVAEAKRIMQKSLDSEAAIFRRDGTFHEKRNGVSGESSKASEYPNQSGFGWTNAVFSRYVSLMEQN